MDISKMCRSCMVERASWESENFNSRILEMFCFCTNLKIIEEDSLPKQFCCNCINSIQSAFTFITEALKVDATLKNIVSRSNTSIIIKPDNETVIKQHTETIKLTLPDYKVCSVIDSFRDPILDENFEFIQGNKIDIPESIDDQCSSINNINDATTITDIPVLKLDNDADVKRNICPVCRKGFTSKTWFNKHMEKEHAGHTYACLKCPKTFAKSYQLTNHETSHSEERKFACSTCGKRYKRRKQLNIHIKNHGDARPYSCDHCGARFKLKSVLRCHMKVHLENKQFLCTFCGWSFTQAGNLKVHMRRHTGEKPFSCGACGFRAADASNLRRHQRRHAGLRPHVCAHCRKGFYDASGLVRHIRTHTGELPYKCPECPRLFADSWKRKSHLMRAHRVALHRIPRMAPDGRTVAPPANV